MVIQVKVDNKPIKLLDIHHKPEVGDFLFLPEKVKVLELKTTPLGYLAICQ